MLKIKWYRFFLLLCVLAGHTAFVHAQPPSVGVQVCRINHSQNDCVFQSPIALSKSTDIDSITLTFTNLSIIVEDGSEYGAEKWGVLFSSPGSGGGTADTFYCNQLNCAQGAINIVANNKDIVVVTTPDSRQNTLTGTLVLTLSRFKNGQLPGKFQSLINSAVNGSLYVNATYSDSTDPDGTAPPHSMPYVWQPDEGALLNAPVLSAFARVGGLVINIKPPSNLDSAKPNVPISPADNPTTLVQANPGHVTGYLLALWLAQDPEGNPSSCGTETNWSFAVNPLAYNPNFGITPGLGCTYTPYVESVDGVGGVSSELGCAFTAPAPPDEPYLQTNENVPSLNPLLTDVVAVPLSITPAEKVKQLQSLLAHPAQEFPVAGTCYSLVYIPASQSSYGKMAVQPGQVYGFTAWALNAAYSTANPDDPTPNLSFAHSNLGFMTAVKENLASTAKDPSLKLTTSDCFVATAASGDENSRSVFYWRILRDEYLTRLGVTKFYYKHGPKWADWLNNHPKYKPAVNFVLEKTGAFFYFSALYAKQTAAWLTEHFKQLSSDISDLWAQEASADEYKVFNYDPLDGSATESTDNISLPDNGKTYANNDDASADNDDTYANNNDTYARSAVGASADDTISIGQRINFDFAFTGGVLFPTSDRSFYKKYYPHATLDFELSSSAILWTSHFGWSLGLKGSYDYNSKTFSEPTLGDATQKDTRFLYFGTIEVIGGVRYRHPNFLYLQPGIFAGAGVLRLREEGKPEGDTGENSEGDRNQTLGITHYSPVFDFGANLDISLSTLFHYADRELALSRDILLRLTAIYRINPSVALASSGLVVNVGFAFLF